MKRLFSAFVIMSIVLFGLLTTFYCEAANGATLYKLLWSKNMDTPAAKITQYDISVPKDTTDEEVRSVLYRAVPELQRKRDVDALIVRLYLEGSGDILPYATAEWAPYGDWRNAERGKSKSTFETSISIYPERRP
jgi:hypothetical protein